MLYDGNASHFSTPVLMNMSNIAFEVPRLNTFVFKKVFRKIIPSQFFKNSD